MKVGRIGGLSTEDIHETYASGERYSPMPSRNSVIRKGYSTMPKRYSAMPSRYSAMPREDPRLREGIHLPIGVEAIETSQPVDNHHQSTLPRHRVQRPTFASSGDVSQQNSRVQLGAGDLPFQGVDIREEQEARVSEWKWDSDKVSPGHLDGHKSYRPQTWELRDSNPREIDAAATRKLVDEQDTANQDMLKPRDEPTGDENRVHRKEIRRSGGRTSGADDPVVFSCFAPPAVSGGMAFLLRISAYLKQQRDDAVDEAQSAGVTEAGVPGGVSIMRNKRVTIKLVRKAMLHESQAPNH